MADPEHETTLTWVIVAGEARRVSDFAALAPRHRPPATCPECARPLTLKLGRIRRHHAAHAPNDRCAATSPETALHINLKFHLAAELRRAIAARQPLVVGQSCVSCQNWNEAEWVHGWDDVAVEARIGAGRRPDVVLRRDGQPIAAIEVRVSHAVSDEKSAVLATLGVPWVEVGADRLAAGDAWTIDRALPVDRSSAPWRCPTHALTTSLRAARVVDVYHDGGARERAIYQLDEQRDAATGDLVALSLRCGKREIATQPTWTKLRLAYTEDVARLTGRPGSFTDSPMRWAEGDVAANLVDEALADTTPYDATPLGSRYPRRWFFARERGNWFLPRDMRDVRWDRTAPDPFAPHQAWTAARTAVRERPVPEYAWRTIAFASRPATTMFGHGVDPHVETPALAIVDATGGGTRRALVVLSQPAADDLVRRVSARLAADGVEHLWLSHPLDWSRERADLAWAASGRDARGRGVVVIDGLGVYRAEHFLSAFARGDARLAPGLVRERMAERVAGLSRRAADR